MKQKDLKVKYIVLIALIAFAILLFFIYISLGTPSEEEIVTLRPDSVDSAEELTDGAEKAGEVQNKDSVSQVSPKESEEKMPVDPVEPIIETSQESPSGGISSAQRQALLAEHNSARSAVGVGPISWSPSVASSAQSWANQLQSEGCSIRHSSTSFGENVFYSWASSPSVSHNSAQRGVESWVSEKANYSYSTNSCASGEVCGHYTQIVWAGSTQVGCGIVSCTGVESKEVLVCQYSPAGNIIGNKPY